MDIDVFTILHALTGMFLALSGVPRAVAYALILGTELSEAGLRSLGVKFFRETEQNIITDIIASTLGYEITKVVLK